MSTPFYTGGFTFNGPLMEWDGTNHADIVTWANEVASEPWAVGSAGATELVLTGTNGATPLARTFQLNGWISRSTLGPQSVEKIPGRWTTPDPYGRPVSAETLLAPEAE